MGRRNAGAVLVKDPLPALLEAPKLLKLHYIGCLVTLAPPPASATEEAVESPSHLWSKNKLHFLFFFFLFALGIGI